MFRMEDLGLNRGRIVGLFWLFAAYAFFLLGRLVKLQYIDHSHYRQQADAQHLGQLEFPALRGEIRDRHDVVLAKSVARWSVAINPGKLRGGADLDRAENILRTALGLDSSDLAVWMRSSESFVWVARKVSDEKAQVVREADIDGLFLVKEAVPGKRYYPKGQLAAQLLGSAGVDDQGLDGLEAAFDHHLAGRPGLLRAFVDCDGLAAVDDPAAMIRPAQPGHSVILTLDETIQYVAEQELARQVEAYDAQGGIVMVMDARSAEILAMAVNPSFPARDFSRVSPQLRRNRCLTDPYEPGSTFKIFLAAAALESGVSVTDRFRSGGVITVDGWPIHNANDGLHSGAMETLETILAYSFNVGTTSVALHIGKEALAAQLQAFGFGRRTGIDLWGEDEGLLSDPQDWADIHTATISFGQGVACTPLQLVSAMQALANGGVRVKPKLVRAVVDTEGNVVERFETEILGRSCSAAVAQQVLQLLENVCRNGTGKKAQVTGFRVGGKTGTAQLVEDGVYSPNKFIASFLGVAPVDDPKIVVLVKIEEPNVQWGGTVAAPVFSRVAEKALWKLGIAQQGRTLPTTQAP